MYIVLLALIVLDCALMALGITLGITLDGADSVRRHFVLGLAISIYTCLIHSLVLFYLIGSGKDIRDAVEDEADLTERYAPWTQVQKRRAFPPACFAIFFMIVAALMGGEVHSRLIAAEGGETLPIRGVSFWWIHAAFVCIAVATSVYAFVVELCVVRDNRHAIQDLNAELDRRADASRPSGSP
jgi:H+/gluconate symporter-like permease